MAYSFQDIRGSAVVGDQLARYQVVVAGEDATGDPDLVRVFDDAKAFQKWAGGSPIAEKVATYQQTLQKQVLAERKNEKWVEQMQVLAIKKKQSNVQAFAKLVGENVRSEAVVNHAMVNRTPLTPQIFDPMFLWDRRIEVEPPQGAPQDSRTSTMFIPSGWWPYLGWFGWDNRARSARVFGVNVLCDGSWFGGRQAWLIGFNMLLNLDHLAFDRITSSIASF